MADTVIGPSSSSADSISEVTHYAVTVTYTVEVKDELALLKAGRQAASEISMPAWGFVVDDGVAEAVHPDNLPPADLTPETSIAMVLSRQPYPSVPGVQFGGMGANVVPLT